MMVQTSNGESKSLEGVSFGGALVTATSGGLNLSDVVNIMVNRGAFTADDWNTLRIYQSSQLADNLKNLTSFVISDGVTVADIPDNSDGDPYFVKGINVVRIAGLKKIGEGAFFGCSSLREVDLPTAIAIGKSAFEHCKLLTTITMPKVTTIADKAFESTTSLERISLLQVEKIGERAFYGSGIQTAVLPKVKNLSSLAFASCSKLKKMSLGKTPPHVADMYVFAELPYDREVDLVDENGTPLTGSARKDAINSYKSDKGYGTDFGTTAIVWWSFKIYRNDNSGGSTPPPASGASLGATIIKPNESAGSVRIAKTNGSTINIGDALKNSDELVVTATPASGYKVKEITASGANQLYNGNWEVKASSGQVVFTVTFESTTPGGGTPPASGVSLGATIIRPNGSAGSVRIAKKNGSTVNIGDALKQFDELVVTTTPASGYKVKEITASGANKLYNGNWEVKAISGQVVFTVTFESTTPGGGTPPASGVSLGATIIKPNESAGSVSISKYGIVLNPGDQLAERDQLAVSATPASGYNVKEITASGANRMYDENWEVTATSGQVVFTVIFESTMPGGNNAGGETTSVESVPLAKAKLQQNPFEDQLTVNAGDKVTRCDVFSADGVKILSVENPGTEFALDLCKQPAGLYIVRLVDAHGLFKILKAIKR